MAFKFLPVLLVFFAIPRQAIAQKHSSMANTHLSAFIGKWCVAEMDEDSVAFIRKSPGGRGSLGTTFTFNEDSTFTTFSDEGCGLNSEQEGNWIYKPGNQELILSYTKARRNAAPAGDLPNHPVVNKILKLKDSTLIYSTESPYNEELFTVYTFKRLKKP